jgi:aerobic-type carbon monoxide dehydrogenase small subunit (CoxS/CutS family)
MRLESSSIKLRAANKNLRGEAITVTIDGQTVRTFIGETIAGALLAEGVRVFRHTSGGSPRGLFCGMGICYDCLVTVDNRPSVRACMTPVANGMEILTGAGVAQEDNL